MNNEQQPFDFSMPEAPQETPAAPEVAPEATPEAAVKAPGFLKGSMGKIIALGVAVLLVVGLIFGAVALFGSNEKTPLNDKINELNLKKYKDPYDIALSHLNGFTEGEFKAIAKILKSSDDYQDAEEDRKEAFEDVVQDKKDEYGDNFKYSYKIDDKDKLDKDDLKDFEDRIQEAGKQLLAMVELTEDDDYDWDAIADSLGISDKDAKAIVKNLEKIGKAWKKADVQAGYEMDITVILKGADLDEPDEEEATICVYKINGKWVAEDFMIEIGGLISAIR